MNKEILKKIKKAIIKSEKIALFHHETIDGDSLSCFYGLYLALKHNFQNKKIVLVGDKDDITRGMGMLKPNLEGLVDQIDNSFLTIIGDTSSKKKIVKLEEYEKGNLKICFDHHQNNPEIPMDIFWHEPKYHASAMQAYEIVKFMKLKLNEEVAFFLMVGLLTDTGQFSFSLNDSLIPQYYSELLKYISKEKMDFYFTTMKRKTMQDIEIMKFIYSNLKIDGQVAYVVVNKETIAKFSDARMKIFLSSFGNVEGTNLWVMFSEMEKEGKWGYKLHLRSNGPDVSKYAQNNNGGGHIRASGAFVPFEEKNIEKIIKELNELK